MALSRASGLARGPVRVTRTTPAPTGFSPTFPWDALRKVQLLAHRRKVQGLSLRGRAFHLTTPAVRDIGGASICIRLEEKDAAEGEAAHLVALREGGYLLGLQGPSAGVFLPAVAGVPCREGLDRSGQSRIGLAECMVFGRPLVTEEDLAGEGQATFLHEHALEGWCPLGSTLEVVVLARVTDFFLGLNAGTWLRIRISDISTAACRWLSSLEVPGTTHVPDTKRFLVDFLEEAQLAVAPEVEAAPSDASELWHFWGGGGNTGMSGQLTRRAVDHQPLEDTRPFRFSYRDINVEVSERLPLANPESVDLTGDLVWPTAVAFCRYLCDKQLVPGRHVLDLSAGTGLVGLVALSLEAASVTLTDQQRVLPLLARNALLASTPDVSKAAEKPFAAHLKVRELSWGEQEAETFRDAEGPFDLVLCCEVVYQQPPEVWRALQETLGKLLRPGGRAVFAYQHRDGAEVTDARFFETLEEASKLQFQMEESLSEWDGVWDDLELRWVRTYVSRNDSSL